MIRVIMRAVKIRELPKGRSIKALTDQIGCSLGEGRMGMRALHSNAFQKKKFSFTGGRCEDATRTLPIQYNLIAINILGVSEMKET
jgi:hypothetical protein